MHIAGIDKKGQMGMFVGRRLKRNLVCLPTAPPTRMNLRSLLSLAATLFVAAAEEQHHPRNRCCKEDAEKAVLALQKQLQEYAKQCDYNAALRLSLPDATFSTLDMFCADSSCCVDQGSMEKWWTYYACWDHIEYPVAPVTVEHLYNGTIVITQPELTATYDANWQRLLYAYRTRYHWYPVPSEKGCDFRLGFINGNDYACPEFLPNAISCDAPECIGGGK